MYLLVFYSILQVHCLWGKIRGNKLIMLEIAPMSKTIVPLTDTKINKSKPKEKPYKIFDGGGLYIEIYPTGSKLWRIKYSFLKKEKRISLGKYPLISLAKAREKRDEIKKLLSDNIDPSTYQKVDKDIITLDMIINEWLEIKKSRVADSTHNDSKRIGEAHIKPILGEYPINKITRTMIADLIKSIDKKTAFNTAKKARHLLNQAFKYAMVKGLIEFNPASDLSIITAYQGVTEHYKSIPFTELKTLLSSVQKSTSNIVTKAYIYLLCLTALRPTELRLSKWSEIEDDNLSIPIERMKKRNTHITPLSKQALYVLDQIKPITGCYEFIFSSLNNPLKPMGRSTANFILNNSNYFGKHSPHGFRHLLSTELNNRGYNHDWIEKQLAHGDTDRIRGTYNHASYLDQRKIMMQEWADSIDFDFKVFK